MSTFSQSGPEVYVVCVMRRHLAGEDMLGRAVGGVHVQDVHLAGLQGRMLSQARLPSHVTTVQDHLQQRV